MFRVCNPFAVSTQVIPADKKYKYDEGSLVEKPKEISITVDRIKSDLKRKPTPEDQKKTNIQTIENEIFLLTMNLKVLEGSFEDYEESLLKSSDLFLHYEVDLSAPQPSTTLVKSLRWILKNKTSSEPFVLINESIANIVISLRNLHQLLSHYQEYPPGYDPTSPYNRNCFTSIHYALIMTDITFAMIIKLLSKGSYLYSQLIPEILFELLSILKNILLAIYEILSLVSESNQLSCSLTLGQILIKANQISICSITLIKSFSISTMANDVSFPLLTNFVDYICCVSNGLSLLKSMLGGNALIYYICVSKYWNISEIIVKFFIFVLAKDSCKAIHPMLNLWYNKLINSLSNTFPNIDELMLEIKRLESRGNMNKTTGTINSLIRILTKNESNKLKNITDGNESNNCNHPTPTPSYVIVEAGVYFHLQFIISGIIQFISLSPTTLNKFPLSPSLPAGLSPGTLMNRMQVCFTALHDILNSLVQLPALTTDKLHLAPVIVHLMRKLALRLPRNLSIDWVYRSLAKMLMKFNAWMRNTVLIERERMMMIGTTTSFGGGLNGNNNHHLNAWNESMSMSMSTASLKSHLNELDFKSIKNNISSPPPSLPNNSFQTPQTTIQMNNSVLSTGNSNMITPITSLEMTMETPFKDLQSSNPIDSSSSSKPSYSSKSSRSNTICKPNYLIGDLVDSLCNLPNGTQRWFPGKVTQVNSDATYTILFEDGDVATNKTVAEIRMTKKRNRGGNSTCSSFVNTPQETHRAPQDDDRLTAPVGSSTPIAILSLERMHTTTSSLSNYSLSNRESTDLCFSPFNEKDKLNGIVLNGSMSDKEKDSSKKINSNDSSFVSGSNVNMNASSNSLFSLKNVIDVREVVEEDHISEQGDEDEDDEDNIFEIPSVLEYTTTSGTKRLENVIPKMQFGNLPVASCLPYANSSPSLSSSLLAEISTPTSGDGANGDCNGNGMRPRQSNSFIHTNRSNAGSTNKLTTRSITTHRSEADDIVNIDSSRSGVRTKSSRPNLAIGNFSEAINSNNINRMPSTEEVLSGGTRLLSWRGEETSRPIGTGRSSGRGASLNPGKSLHSIHSMQTLPLHKLHNANSSHSVTNNSSRGAHNTTNNRSAKDLASSRYSENSFYEMDHTLSINEKTLQSLIQSHFIIVCILLQYANIAPNWLDILCSQAMAPALSDTTNSYYQSFSDIYDPIQLQLPQASHINILFAIREYLDIIMDEYPILLDFLASMFSLFTSDTTIIRLLKLLHPAFFNTCLAEHMLLEPNLNESTKLQDPKEEIFYPVKIGEGSFGNVFKISCPKSCNGMHNMSSRCFFCYQTSFLQHYLTLNTASTVYHPPTQNITSIINTQINRLREKSPCRCWKQTLCAPCGTNTNNNAMTSAAGKTAPKLTPSSQTKPSLSNAILDGNFFAIKRIPRERSSHDPSVLYNIYNEITCLETLSQCIGICGIEDYGIIESEYCLILELGDRTLLDYRLQYQNFPPSIAIASPRTGLTAPLVTKLNLYDILIFLIIFYDVVLILRDVHDNQIIHFDLKLNNFLIRKPIIPYLMEMITCHQYNQPSGLIFLADFGEAVPLTIPGQTQAILKQESSKMEHISPTNPANSRPNSTNNTISNGASVALTSMVEGLLKKSRGTMAIQSPEMLCNSDHNTSDSSSMLSNNTLVSEIHSFDPKKTFKEVFLPHASSRFSTLSQQEKAFSSESFASSSLLSPSPSNQFAHLNKHKAYPLPNKPSDIWSLGCTFNELFTGEMLFANKAWPELYTKLCLAQKLSFDFFSLREILSPLPLEWSKELFLLLEQMMAQHPNERFVIHDIILCLRAFIYEKDYFAEELKQFSCGLVGHAPTTTVIEKKTKAPSATIGSSASSSVLGIFTDLNSEDPFSHSLMYSASGNSMSYSLPNTPYHGTGQNPNVVSLYVGSNSIGNSFNSTFEITSPPPNERNISGPTPLSNILNNFIRPSSYRTSAVSLANSTNNDDPSGREGIAFPTFDIFFSNSKDLLSIPGHILTMAPPFGKTSPISLPSFSPLNIRVCSHDYFKSVLENMKSKMTKGSLDHSWFNHEILAESIIATANNLLLPQSDILEETQIRFDAVLQDDVSDLCSNAINTQSRRVWVAIYFDEDKERRKQCKEMCMDSLEYIEINFRLNFDGLSGEEVSDDFLRISVNTIRMNLHKLFSSQSSGSISELWVTLPTSIQKIEAISPLEPSGPTSIESPEEFSSCLSGFSSPHLALAMTIASYVQAKLSRIGTKDNRVLDVAAYSLMKTLRRTPALPISQLNLPYALCMLLCLLDAHKVASP